MTKIKSQAIVFPAPNEVNFEQIDVAEPGAGELLLEAQCTLISPGTERTFLTGKAPFIKYPFRPGYSFAGHVKAIGPDVEGFSVGDAVISHATHARHVVVPQEVVFKVPDGVEPECAAFFNLALAAMIGLRNAQIEFGEPIAVLGQGPIGLITTQLVKLAGGSPVVALDRAQNRLDQALALGADIAINTSDESQMEQLKQLPGGGPAAVIELTSAIEPLEMAIQMARVKGRVVLVSAGTGGGISSEGMDAVFMKGLSIIGSFVGVRPYFLMQTPMAAQGPPTKYIGPGFTHHADVELFLWQLQHKRLEIKALISHRVKADRAEELFKRIVAFDPEVVGPILIW